ncbi:YlbF family regulator, partial [Staphylococcus capitis]|uniref:YlbF family regulator n=1 Tax=Staphylococcus capitis TaxID=29388 RepID=UPI003D02D810
MAVNLYDYANQLEQALRDSEEYKAIKDAFAKVKENEESKKLRGQALDELFDAILALENREECYQFFDDLC